MRLRLEPSDELMHPLEEATNFNESMYFNVYDPGERIGGFLRLGNRANEGYAEMTTCLYLPDGRVAFTYHRPEITHNEAFDAGGMRFEVVEPFEHLRASYQGKICILERPLEMADPRRAFTENPWADCAVKLEYRGLSPMLGGEPVNDDGTPITQKADEGFARGHYEQHVGARGTMRVGDDEWVVDGVGLRDHSWGPRFWQSPWWYRWLTGNFGDDGGFVLSIVTRRDGARHVGGVWLADGVYEPLVDIQIDTEWRTDDTYHDRIHAVARTKDAEHVIDGKVLSLIPLRNRRTTPDGEQLVTRISEGMTEWRDDDGRVGYGLSEYLDQIVDGQPVGATA
ncbi:MAG: hypothetical protein MUP97_15845 [Acidimicrobiia bacterium]|nr:hypothetical protein [Acidimicrobiia bacterium]